MRQLSFEETQNVTGAFRIKLHFNPFHALFTIIGGGLLGGPVGAAMGVAAVLGAQGTGNLHDMYKDHYGRH